MSAISQSLTPISTKLRKLWMISTKEPKITMDSPTKRKMMSSKKSITLSFFPIFFNFVGIVIDEEIPLNYKKPVLKTNKFIDVMLTKF